MSNSKDIITALSDGDLLKVPELVNDDLLSRVAVKIDERIDPRKHCDNNKVEEVETVNEEEALSTRSSSVALKKFGVSDPSEFDSDEKKKNFPITSIKTLIGEGNRQEDPDADDEEKVARDKAKKSLKLIKELNEEIN